MASRRSTKQSKKQELDDWNAGKIIGVPDYLAARKPGEVQYFEPRPDPRAHIKRARGAAPALFDPRQMKPADELRWPRGYTPERMDAVRGGNRKPLFDISPGNFGPFSVTSAGETARMSGGGHNPTDDRTSVFTPGPLGETTGFKDVPTDAQRKSVESRRKIAQRDVHEVIARSMVPLMDLHRHVNREYPASQWGIDQQYNGDPLSIETGRELSPGVGGIYSRSYSQRRPGVIRLTKGYISEGAAFGIPQPTRHLREDEAMGQILIHELGHYHSREVEGNQFSRYETDAQKGKEEAYADDFKMTHWRPDPRDVRRGNRARNAWPPVEKKVPTSSEADIQRDFVHGKAKGERSLGLMQPSGYEYGSPAFEGRTDRPGIAANTYWESRQTPLSVKGLTSPVSRVQEGYRVSAREIGHLGDLRNARGTIHRDQGRLFHRNNEDRDAWVPNHEIVELNDRRREQE